MLPEFLTTLLAHILNLSVSQDSDTSVPLYAVEAEQKREVKKNQKNKKTTQMQEKMSSNFEKCWEHSPCIQFQFCTLW